MLLVMYLGFYVNIFFVFVWYLFFWFFLFFCSRILIAKSSIKSSAPKKLWITFLSNEYKLFPIELISCFYFELECFQLMLQM